MVTYILSASKLNIMDSCWERYNLEYNRRWTPNDKAPALENGSLVHTVFRHFYKEKLKRRWATDPTQMGIVLDEACNIARRDAASMNISVKDSDESIRVARENLVFHANDGMTVHAVEEPFSKVLWEDPNYIVDPKNPGLRIIFEGIVDLVAELPNNPISVWDHKSESRRSTPSKLSNQFEGSAWAFGVETVVVNKVGFQTSLKEHEKFRRIFLEYNDTGLISEWRQDAIMRVLEAVELHKREAAGRPQWRRNRTSCDKYSGCIFKPVCEAKPVVRDVKLMTWFHIREPHELYEAPDEQVAEVASE